MLADAANKCLILNTNSIAGLLQCRDLATTDDRNLSAMLFALHETFHVVQGIPDHGDIRRIKQLGGKWLISFLDLRSTSHAANLLADLLALNVSDQPSASTRDEVFKRLWVDIGHASLHAFPIYNNPAKCQRFVGHLMTSVLLLNPGLWPSWSTRHVLWPVWSANEDELLILSNTMNVLVPPTTVPRVTLRGAIECLCAGDTVGALPQIQRLLDSLRPSAAMLGTMNG